MGRGWGRLFSLSWSSGESGEESSEEDRAAEEIGAAVHVTVRGGVETASGSGFERRRHLWSLDLRKKRGGSGGEKYRGRDEKGGIRRLQRECRGIGVEGFL
jgi:hypothetical protein